MVMLKVQTNDIDKKLNEIASRMDFSEPLKASVELLKREAIENIDRQGAIYQGGGFVREGGAFSYKGIARTYTGSWKPLAPSTKKDRVAKGYPASRPIMVRTGKLKKSFRTLTQGSHKASITNTAPYAMYHQKGGGTGFKNVLKKGYKRTAFDGFVKVSKSKTRTKIQVADAFDATKAVRTGLPQRKILGVSNKSALAIKIIFSNFLKKIFR